MVGGKDALIVAATLPSAELVVTAVVGAAGIEPTVEAIKAKKTIGLANKETLVAGGPLITALCKEYGVQLLPIDSEHSAIFQCLEGQTRENVDSLLITASGGPLRTWPSEKLQQPQQPIVCVIRRGIWAIKLPSIRPLYSIKGLK